MTSNIDTITRDHTFQLECRDHGVCQPDYIEHSSFGLHTSGLPFVETTGLHIRPLGMRVEVQLPAMRTDWTQSGRSFMLFSVLDTRLSCLEFTSVASSIQSMHGHERERRLGIMRLSASDRQPFPIILISFFSIKHGCLPDRHCTAGCPMEAVSGFSLARYC